MKEKLILSMEIISSYFKNRKINKLDVIYVILAHKNPEQLKRLINRLDAPATSFYIHIDENQILKTFEKALNRFKNTSILKNEDRFSGVWGDIGIVKATLAAMRKKGFVVLLSGQDYPLQNNEKIRSFFSKNKESHFITAYPIPHAQLDQGGLPRINQYKINKSYKRGHFLFLNSIFESKFYSLETAGKLNFLRKSGNWTGIFKIFKRRKFPKYLKPYAGSQWWALSTQTIKKIIEFIEKYPEYLEYHRYSLLPDEMFFQSIIIHIKEAHKSEIKKSLTYVNWERPTGPLPVTFKKEDFQELEKASKNYLFARKFDMEQDAEILDEIDKELLN